MIATGTADRRRPENGGQGTGCGPGGRSSALPTPNPWSSDGGVFKTLCVWLKPPATRGPVTQPYARRGPKPPPWVSSGNPGAAVKGAAAVGSPQRPEPPERVPAAGEAPTARCLRRRPPSGPPWGEPPAGQGRVRSRPFARPPLAGGRVPALCPSTAMRWRASGRVGSGSARRRWPGYRLKPGHSTAGGRCPRSSARP